MNVPTKLFLACTASTAALALGSTAIAQTARAAPADNEVEEIVVTGTSIRGVAAVGSPTVSVDRDEIVANGRGTLSEIARTIPQVINIGADETRLLRGAQDSAANTTKVNGVNLRGVGTEATLVLVNGRRIAPNGVIKAAYDISQIPNSAIQRLEVVLDGASAIYGADAVAGVFNIITRRNFDGAETTLKYGMGDSYDAKIFSQVLGKTWDRGSAFVTYEYNNRSALNASERPFLSSDLSGRGGLDQRLFTSNPGNILTVAAGNNASIRYPIPTGQDGRNLRTRTLTPGTANRWDEFIEGDFLAKQVRHTVYANLYYEVTDKLEIHYDGFYARRHYYQDTPGVGATITVPTSNPFFVPIAGITFPLCPAALGAPAGMRCQSVEYNFGNQFNPNIIGSDDNFSHFIGAKWDIWGDWQVNAGANYGLNRGFQSRKYQALNQTQLSLALLDTNPATALNVYGDNGGNNPATLAKVLRIRDTYAKAIQIDYSLKADGPIFDLPGGKVRLAVGVDYQDTDFKGFLADSSADPNNIRNTNNVYPNARTSWGAFGELFVPLVGADNAMPFAQRLEMNLAIRRDDYSDFGSTTNPKVGVQWQPIEGLMLRGTWSTAFRAPSLIDSAEGLNNAFNTRLADPRAAGALVDGLGVNGTRLAIGPEDATTWSLGFDFEPAFIPGLRVSASYYDMTYRDLIGIPPTNLALAALYPTNINLNPTDAEKLAIIALPTYRGPALPLSSYRFIIDTRRSNLGVLKQDGLDVQVTYGFDTDAMGSFLFGFDFAKVYNLDRTLTSAVPISSFIDVLHNAVDFRGRGYATWKMGDFTANLFVNYVDNYRNDAVTPNQIVKSWTTFDGALSYSFGENAPYRLDRTKVTLSGQNLFDKDPPTVFNGRDAWDGEMHGALGRFVSLEISKSW